MVNISRVDGSEDAFQGCVAGPLYEGVGRLKRVDPHLQIISNDQSELRVVIGGFLYDVKVTRYVNTYFATDHELRELFGVMEAVEV